MSTVDSDDEGAGFRLPDELLLMASAQSPTPFFQVSGRQKDTEDRLSLVGSGDLSGSFSDDAVS